MTIHKLSSRQGSALLTVVMLIAIMAILTGSMLKYTMSERRGNERNRLILRSKNMAENVTLYSAEQISTKLHRMKTVSLMKFTSGANQLYLPPDAVLTTSFSAPSDVESYAGITANTGLTLITDTTNTNYGLQVLTGTVPIIAKSRMTHPAMGSITTYAEQDMQINEIPLFQFAIFYNKDLEFSPGADMIISGPVHSNGDLIARDQTSFTNIVQFKDRVTAVGGFYANSGYKGTIYNEYDGADAGPGGTGPLRFQNPTGTVTDIQSSGGVWRDHKYGGTSVTTTSVANFKTFATSSYAGNFRTSAHQVSALTLPGIEDTSSTNSGRNTIEPADAADSADLVTAGTQFSRKAGLYIIVNPTSATRTGKLPDATTVSMRAYSYRCWLNTINTDQTHTLQEVIIPGQPSYGALNANVNNLPNAYRVDTSVYSNQVLRIPEGASTTVDLADTGNTTMATPTMTTFTDAYFYDMRRATNSNGHPFSRTTASFLPRPIAKIDFDMTRFKMMVDRTLNSATSSTVYFPGRPNAGTWNNSIFNPSGTTASYGLGLSSSYNTFNAQVGLPAIAKSNGAVYVPGTVKINATSQVAALASTAYTGRFIVSETTSATLTAPTWTTLYTSAADESSYTYTPTAGITFARIRLYRSGGTADQFDEQIIPMVTDGTTTVNASLSNDYMIVPSIAAGVTVASNFTTNPVVTEMRVYIGANDDTANWTYSAAVSSGVTGSFGTGTLANRYTVTAMTSTTTSTVTLTATKGSTTVSKVFTLAKESAVTNAGILQTGYWLTVTSPALPDPFKMYFAPANPADPLIVSNPSSFAVAPTNLYNAGTGPWYDGLTVYIHSTEAEDLTVTGTTRNRMDSGVRLWNGRGPAASMTASGVTGMSFCTNDPVYIMGHFNADGTINATSTDTTAYGGYSARYPDSANEYLTSVMGDALTILSQPVFTSSSGSYYQSSGWSDSLSANRCRNTNYSTSWSTTNPSNSNSVDGSDRSVVPAAMPNISTTGSAATSTAGAGSAVDVKFDPSVTEVSACLLAGIVETNSHQHSGGVHNFPRLNEDWAGTGLYIRGAMIAMFASEIATEPWSIRIYSGAGRYWGLHQNLRNASHDVPLEPMVISASRLAYKELSAADYATMKATILALP
jgi:hypothetical protein